MPSGQNALALTYDSVTRGTADRPFIPPTAVVSYSNVSKESYPDRLVSGNQTDADGNPLTWSIVLSDNYSSIRVSPLDLLRGILVLKRIVDLNGATPLTLSDFHIGRQIIFPSQDELKEAYHLVDRDVARLFYEVFTYYATFGLEFNREANRITKMLDNVDR